MRAGLAALTYAFGREVSVAVLARLLGDLLDRASIERQVLAYIAQVYNVTEDTFRAAIRQARPGQEEELMTTLAEQWKQEGKAEGKAEGQAETVIETLEARFGPLDLRQREKIRHMPTEALSRLNLRAITAPTVQDALADDGDR